MNNLYLLYGKEDFLIENEIRAIRNKIEQANSGGIVFEDWSSADLDWEKLVNLTLGGGLFSSTNLLIIRDFDELDLEEREEEFIRIISGLPDSSFLILVQHGAPKSGALNTAIKSKAEIKEFQPFNKWQESDIANWIGKLFESKGKKITPDAVELLAEVVGSDMRLLGQEAEKAITYAGTNNQITYEDVAAVVSEGELDVFNLSEALKEKNSKDCIYFLSKALKNSEEPTKILGLLASQFRSLVMLSSIKNETKDTYAISQKLGMKPFVVNKNLNLLSRFKPDELRGSITLMHEADLNIKSGKDPKITLEMLVTQICRS